MSQETITIHVTAPAAGPKQLNYTGTAGLSVTPKGGSVKAKQKIDIGDDVAWTCSDGGFVIQFLGATSPFTDGTMQLMGSSGAATPFKTTTKKKSRKKPFEYVVSVSQPGTQPPIMEDPDLDIFD